jgi:hypothetical protein
MVNERASELEAKVSPSRGRAREGWTTSSTLYNSDNNSNRYSTSTHDIMPLQALRTVAKPQVITTRSSHARLVLIPSTERRRRLHPPMQAHRLSLLRLGR